MPLTSGCAASMLILAIEPYSYYGIVGSECLLSNRVKVRRAVEEDIPRILELYRELTITTSDAESLRKPSPGDYRQVFNEIDAAQGHELLVLQYSEDVVGTLALIIVPNLSHSGCPWAIAENLIVDQRYRRQGLGRLLMEYAVTRAQQARCHKLVLTSDKRRDDAHRFYRSLGFESSAEGFRMYF